ncbi:hypothetical protein [Blastomonas sp.]|uniref:hypothetical protein n=1 Tax=Blastomonas sp. TaxID=1909299 RepID=UPI00391BB71E
MHNDFVSAIFDDHSQAERAVSQLRSAGVNDSAISVIARHEGSNTVTDGAGAEQTTDIVGKAALGAGAGALLGIAALAIPGVGPFIAAGAIAEAAVGGAAITGTAVGAAAGGIVGLLTNHGVDKDDATHYEDRLNQGGIFVSVDAASAGLSTDQVRDVLFGAGGYNPARSRSGTLA